MFLIEWLHSGAPRLLFSGGRVFLIKLRLSGAPRPPFVGEGVSFMDTTKEQKGVHGELLLHGQCHEIFTPLF